MCVYVQGNALDENYQRGTTLTEPERERRSWDKISKQEQNPAKFCCTPEHARCAIRGCDHPTSIIRWTPTRVGLNSRRFFVFSVVRSFVCNIRDPTFQTSSLQSQTYWNPLLLHSSPVLSSSCCCCCCSQLAIEAGNYYHEEGNPCKSSAEERRTHGWSGAVVHERSGTNIIEMSETQVLGLPELAGQARITTDWRVLLIGQLRNWPSKYKRVDEFSRLWKRER